MPRLIGKVAFLTGGGAGIAKVSALEFVKEGAKVAIVDINAEVGKRAEQEIKDAGGEVIFIQADVTQDAAVKQAIDTAVAKFGKLNVLVNCAGGSVLEDVPVHEMRLDIWHKTITLNLLHPFLVCTHGIPHLIKAGGGSIINFSSMVGMTGLYRPAYAAAKGGIMSFTKTLAAQYVQYGIRANAQTPSVPAASAPSDISSAIKTRHGWKTKIPPGPSRNAWWCRSCIRFPSATRLILPTSWCFSRRMNRAC